MRLAIREDIQLWQEGALPARLIWRAERWRIIDQPSLQSSGPLWDNWRFTARSDVDHRTAVMDVEHVGDRWMLVASWD